jgi:hypothetical protein
MARQCLAFLSFLCFTIFEDKKQNKEDEKGADQAVSPF